MLTGRQPANIPNQRCGADVGSLAVYGEEEVTKTAVDGCLLSLESEREAAVAEVHHIEDQEELEEALNAAEHRVLLADRGDDRRIGCGRAHLFVHPKLAGEQESEPCTERIVTIPSATAIAGSVIANSSIVSATQASEPIVATAKGICQRRSVHAFSRHPSKSKIGIRFTAVNSASHDSAWGNMPIR